MPAVLKLELVQVKEIIEQFSDAEKQELALFINKLTIEKLWEQFIQSKKDIFITEEEIASEVEFVRSKRYSK